MKELRISKEQNRQKFYLILFILILTFIIFTLISLNFFINREEVKAETAITNIVTDNFEYLLNLEKEYRVENPNVTPNEVVTFLNDKIRELQQNNSLILMSDNSTVNTEYIIFGKPITSAELELITLYPAQAVIAFNASKDAEEIVVKYYEGTYKKWATNADALRHAYWNALMERRISKDVVINIGSMEEPSYIIVQVDFAKEFAEAHEYGQTSLDSEMDLLNNEIGRNDAVTYSELDEEELSFKIVERIAYGYYWRIINNESSEGDLMPTNWEGLKEEYFEQIMFDTTEKGENEIRINHINWEIEGAYEIPDKLNEKFVTEIGDGAFENQTLLTSITVPTSVNSIGDNAFKGCTNLSSINMLNNSVTIGDFTFSGCISLTNINLPNTMNYVGTGMFEGCSSLTNLILPSTVIGIEDRAFKGCNSLTNINIPANLTYIGVNAFEGCESLTSMGLPASLTNLGNGAFIGCNNLNLTISTNNPVYSAETNIIYNKNRTQIFAGTKTANEIIIPDTVTQINSYAFAENSNLQSVHFNNSIIIGTSAFENCENLENVYFYSVYTPQVDTNAFANDEFNLYVPYNYQSDYGAVFSEYNANVDSLEMQVQFVVEGAVLGTQDVMYGSLVNYSTIPTKEGYTFEGWVDSNGEKYIDTAGNGIKLVDKTEDFILEPDWAIKSYKIKINGNGFVTWLGPNGLSEDECEIEYGTIISSINLIAEFKDKEQSYKEGYVFERFEYDDQTLNWTSIPDLGADGIEVEIIPQWIKETHTIYFNTLCSSTIAEITKQYGESISIPTGLTNTGYHFAGWYQNSSYTGGEVDWATMPDLTPKTADNTYTAAQNNGSVQLYAKWEQISYNVIYNANGGTGSMAASQHLYHEEKQLNSCTFDREGYYFIGWSRTNNNEVEFEDRETVKGLTEESSITLYACWEAEWFTFYCHTAIFNDEGSIELLSSTPFDVLDIEFGQSASTEAPPVEGYVFKRWATEAIPMSSVVDGIHITITFDNIPGALEAFFVFAIYEKDSCVAEGTMITLADGSQKAVEDLTGDEELLVWNMLTGEFDSAPIVFIDSEPERYYEVINLYFSDGTTVKVISEHAFWDINLNKYVYLRSDAAQYIGHWFNKQTIDENGNMVYTEVQLTNVVVQQEYTSAWSPVTYGHLCYYVNGMLSMPGE